MGDRGRLWEPSIEEEGLSMSHPILRLNDGFDHTSPELRDEVKTLQTELNQEGFGLEVDGLFGRDTESAVKRFQREHGLDDDAIVGPLTWAALLGTTPPDLSTVFPTTFPQNHAGLMAQFGLANTRYKAFIDDAAKHFGFQPSVIGGVGSRESQWGLDLKPNGAGPAGTGDFTPRRFPTRFRPGPLPPEGGFGRGLMQIDFDAFEFARMGNWKDPAANIRFGCQVLAQSQDFLQRKTNLEGRALLRAAIAGYNAGPGNALRAIRDGHDIDFFTTGRDYSKDVLNRAGFFQLNGWT
jgi:Putative peptidoglycan binding domain/Transglycosylase SLT domain